MQMRPADKAEMQKHFEQMCSDRYARTVGEMAFLEVRLALSDKQRPLFDRWKSVKLASAKARLSECAAHRPPDKPPSIVDLMKLEESNIRARLDDLEAEMPALEALFNSLGDEQKQAFEGGDPMAPMGPERGSRPPMPPGDDCMADPGAMGRGEPPPPPQ